MVISFCRGMQAKPSKQCPSSMYSTLDRMCTLVNSSSLRHSIVKMPLTIAPSPRHDCAPQRFHSLKFIFEKKLFFRVQYSHFCRLASKWKWKWKKELARAHEKKAHEKLIDSQFGIRRQRKLLLCVIFFLFVLSTVFRHNYLRFIAESGRICSVDSALADGAGSGGSESLVDRQCLHR